MINTINNLLLKHWEILLSIIILSTVFIVLYPTNYIAIDEHDYLYNSKNIINNTLQMECDGSISQFQVDDYCIYKYNIGTSILLLPATNINDNLTFGTTFLMFLISIIYFYKTLLLTKISKYFIFLFAFFPPFLYYSRTLYSEVYSLAFITIALYHFSKILLNKTTKDFVYLGLALSIASLIRYSNLIVAIIVAGYLFVLYSKSAKKKLIYFILGGLPIALFWLWVNNYLYGSPLRSGYYFSGEESAFAFSNIFSQGIKYLAALLIMYPGLLLGLKHLNKHTKFISVLIVSTFWLLYSLFTNNNTLFEGRLLDFIFGLRFFIPIMPFLLLGYCKMINIKLIKWKGFKQMYILLTVLLIINYVILSLIHQGFLINH